MSKRGLGLFLIAFLTLILLVLFGYFLWHRYQYAVSNALFVQADRLVLVSFSKVSGRIVELHKQEGEIVKEGEILAEISPDDYHLRVKQLEESFRRVSLEREALEKTRQKLEKEIALKGEQIAKQIKALKEKERGRYFQWEALQVRLEQTRKDKTRLEKLLKEGLISARDLEIKETEERDLLKQSEVLLAEIRAIEEEIKVLEKNISILQNEKRTLDSLSLQAKALFHQGEEIRKRGQEANLYLEETQLRSPISGQIAKKFRSVGDVVSPGEPLYAIVDPTSYYILVLLEETKLRGVVKGAKARIKLDAYPDKIIEGEVEEVLPASAATFALVPRDISAGEFTKLAQRIPVRIKISKGDQTLLRVGLSGEVEIKRVR